MTWVRRTEAGSLVDVWVVPGASRTSVDGLHNDALKVRVTAPPERGRATRSVEALLATVLSADVELVTGTASRRKVFLVRGIDPVEVATRLGLA